MTLLEAMNAVANTQSALLSADGVLTDANNKLTAAQETQKAAADNDATAIATANQALDDLITTANAAKR